MFACALLLGRLRREHRHGWVLPDHADLAKSQGCSSGERRITVEPRVVADLEHQWNKGREQVLP